MVAYDNVIDLKKLISQRMVMVNSTPPSAPLLPNSNVQPVYQYNKLAGKIYTDLKNALTMLHKAF